MQTNPPLWSYVSFSSFIQAITTQSETVNGIKENLPELKMSEFKLIIKVYSKIRKLAW